MISQNLFNLLLWAPLYNGFTIAGMSFFPFLVFLFFFTTNDAHCDEQIIKKIMTVRRNDDGLT